MLATVTPPTFLPIVAEPLAIFPLLVADLETVCHDESYIVTFILAEVQVAPEDDMEKVPFKTAFHCATPLLL